MPLPKEWGRSYPYYKAAIHHFRRPAIGGGKWEAVASTQPHYFKAKIDAKAYVRQVALANKNQFSDWRFAVEWLGIEYLKVKEDPGRPNNGHECPRCGIMTMQGDRITDLCETCSRVRLA